MLCYAMLWKQDRNFIFSRRLLDNLNMPPAQDRWIEPAPCNQYRRLPFRLCNGPATLERLKERALACVPWSRCVVCLNDLLMYAADFQSALVNLQEVFHAIHQAGCGCIRKSASCYGQTQHSWPQQAYLRPSQRPSLAYCEARFLV